MTRAEKVNFLERLAVGAASIHDLEPARSYSIVFVDGPEPEGNVSEYRPGGNSTRMTAGELADWLQRMADVNSQRREPHKMIRLNVVPDEGCKQLYHCRELANCLHGCGCGWRADAMTGNNSENATF